MNLEQNILQQCHFQLFFPDGIADPTSQATVRNISNNDTESFAQKIKHLIRFAEHVNGKWVYRFASHPRFAYWAYNILYRRRILGQGNLFIKQNPGEANLTIDELRAMLCRYQFDQLPSPLGTPGLLHQNVCPAPGLLHYRKCPGAGSIKDDVPGAEHLHQLAFKHENC